MKKLALPLALAASLAFAAPTTARADGGATAAIIAGIIVGGALLNTAHCGQVYCGWWWAPGSARVAAVQGPLWSPLWPWYQRPTVTVKSRKKA